MRYIHVENPFLKRNVFTLRNQIKKLTWFIIVTHLDGMKIVKKLLNWYLKGFEEPNLLEQPVCHLKQKTHVKITSNSTIRSQCSTGKFMKTILADFKRKRKTTVSLLAQFPPRSAQIENRKSFRKSTENRSARQLQQCANYAK